MSKTVLELKNVSKIYQMDDVGVKALDNVNLKIDNGEFVSIMGPSGSGKSTMMNLIGCLDRPTHGKVLIDGIDTSKLNDNKLAKIRGKKIGFVFQTFNLINRLNALENVMLPMWFEGVPAKEREIKGKEILKSVGLVKREYHMPNQLSGGERQRVAIARALANDPDVILADEPTGSLDSKSGKEILKIFHHLNEKGRTIIIITHEPKVGKHAKRKVKLFDGKIVKQ